MPVSGLLAQIFESDTMPIQIMIARETKILNKTELETFVADLLTCLLKTSEETTASIVTLVGDLGTGKTTLVQTLAKQLGIKEVVTSPTFVVAKHYELSDNPNWDRLVHIDAYRFEKEDEALPLGLPALFVTPRTLICIEWPERLGQYLPKSRHQLQLAAPSVDSEERIITYERH